MYYFCIRLNVLWFSKLRFVNFDLEDHSHPICLSNYPVGVLQIAPTRQCCLYLCFAPCVSRTQRVTSFAINYFGNLLNLAHYKNSCLLALLALAKS